MTADQSRLLKLGDRVCWKGTDADLGAVAGTAWSGVTIAWNDDQSDSIRHNDMTQIERVPAKKKPETAGLPTPAKRPPRIHDATLGAGRD